MIPHLPTNKALTRAPMTGAARNARAAAKTFIFVFFFWCGNQTEVSDARWRWSALFVFGACQSESASEVMWYCRDFFGFEMPTGERFGNTNAHK